jgi:polysaccharide pyruvyl transferase WcaK-like protein
LNPPLYDVYICGSDQIWNPSFTARGERKITLSYFLDFGPVTVKRIAYAVSFGTPEYPEYLINLVSPILSEFAAISVRENSGCEIVQKMGRDDVCLMPDPTLLLRAKDYDFLLQPSRKIHRNFTFFYTLHSNQKTVIEIKNYFTRHLRHYIVDAGSPGNSMIGIESWLSFIKSSDIVVTNSYHGMILSIIFRKPFIVIMAEGNQSSMNDRIDTLLGKIGLLDRIIERYDENRINTILAQKIDWDGVESRIDSLREDAWQYFEKNLNKTFTH